jgi:hypothetical protein
MAYFDANGIDATGQHYQHWLGDQPAALAVFADLLKQADLRVVTTSDP